MIYLGTQNGEKLRCKGLTRLRSRKDIGHTIEKQLRTNKETDGKVFVPLVPFCGHPSDAEQVKDVSLRNAKWIEAETEGTKNQNEPQIHTDKHRCLNRMN